MIITSVRVLKKKFVVIRRQTDEMKKYAALNSFESDNPAE